MKNCASWKPNKYIYKKGKLIASRDTDQVSIGSRLITDLVAQYYDENLKKYAKGKLLDLGCGKIPLYIAYRNYVIDNVCVDWGNTLHQNEHLDFECNLNSDLPFSDRVFNNIILSDVLEHIHQPKHLCAEISRILAPNGKLLINVPFYYPLHERPHDYYRYTEFSLRRFIENSGMKLLYLDSIGGTPEIIADIFAKHCIHIPKIGGPLARLIQYITLLFIRTRLGEKISDVTKNTFPLGYFLVSEKTP